MAPSHSTVRSIVWAAVSGLLGSLVTVPGSPVGSYLETRFGVSNVLLIQTVLFVIGVILVGYCIYTIVRLVVIWRRVFHAEIVGKDRFVFGDTVHFRAWFKGQLKHGLFTCHVRLADGRFEYWPAYDTFRRSENGDLGVLSGRKVHEAEWFGPVLKDHPTGYYEAHIKVCDRADLDSGNLTVKEKLVSFWVLPPGYVSDAGGSEGVSATVTSSGDTGFIHAPIAQVVKPSEKGYTRTSLEFEDWEDDVKWRLPSYLQPDPTFHQINIPGSDTASKLHCKQTGKMLEFTYDIKSLEPNKSYYVQIGLYLSPQKWHPKIPDTIIHSAAIPNGEWDQFIADAQVSSGERSFHVYTDDLARKARDILRRHNKDRLELIQLWVNEAGTDRAVLGSDRIQIGRKMDA